MSFIAWMIVACEIAFWVVIVAGLTSRYIFEQKKLGFFLLALTPVIDLILIVITGMDLAGGATATQAHAIAAVYIGVSIGFGKSMIQWADERFLYYVAKRGPKPAKKYGMEHAKHYLSGWIRHVAAYLIGAAVLTGLIFFIGDVSRTEALSGVLKIWSLVLGVDLLITVSNFVWPKRARA